jgi:hypothetical protein
MLPSESSCMSAASPHKLWCHFTKQQQACDPCFLSPDGGMVCHSGWMNNTSLGTLDLLHVSFIHHLELMAEICG